MELEGPRTTIPNVTPDRHTTEILDTTGRPAAPPQTVVIQESQCRPRRWSDDCRRRNERHLQGVQAGERRWAMDRVRALSPAISGAAHAVAAGVLTCVPLFLTDRLPAPPSFQSPPEIGGGPVVVLAGGSVPHVKVPQPPLTRKPTPDRPAFPLDLGVASVPVPDTGLDLGSLGPGIGQGSDEAAALCLFDCGAGPRPQAGTARDPSEPTRSPLRVRVGGDIREPVKVRDIAPAYPTLALAARVQGPVVLQCVITTEGQVSKITVVSGHPLLKDAAVAAVRGWHYRPTLLNGEPVSVILTVTVTFSLR